ncbi:hypothetical protein [Telmatospirillum sp.]|uniref:hypothetical protein n=1 Tax=Telmatospirillum sp. TaxID=2079197 RepID=UPI002841491D|nr:hypothetical protein [Telmatospirillum sp.]MDR3439876.1 hypothetical protein [Telmatospirillum sp.]
MNPEYQFEEFPKALYRNGEYVSVEKPAEEKALRKAGWTDWPLDQAKIAAGKFADGGGLTGDDQGAADQPSDLLSQ